MNYMQYEDSFTWKTNPGYQMLQYSYRLTGLWMYLAIQSKSDQFLAEAVAT